MVCGRSSLTSREVFGICSAVSKVLVIADYLTVGFKHGWLAIC